jgi:hypothetical protein
MSNSRAARIAELTTDLAFTRASIRQIVQGGQAYSAEGRAMTRADLAALRALEKDQRSELDQLERGTATRVYGVVHR